MDDYAHYFVIPGLLHLTELDWEVINADEFPHLNQFFNASKQIATEQKNLDAVIVKQLRFDSFTVPLAQHFSSTKNTLIATPISLKTDINSTWIQPSRSSANIKIIISDMIDFFDGDIELLMEIDNHFIIDFKHCDVLTNLPHYLSVLGKKLDAYQSSIREYLTWFKLVNEIQMFIHGHPLNKDDAGQQIFNSLWFWGGASLADISINKTVNCDDELMQQALGNHCSINTNSLIIKTDLLKFLKLNIQLSIHSFFSQLEQEFSCLNLKHICIDTTEGKVFVYDRLSGLKFWQSKQPLGDIMMPSHDNL